MARRLERYEHKKRRTQIVAHAFEENWRDLQRIAPTSIERLLNLEGDPASDSLNRPKMREDTIKFLRKFSGVRTAKSDSKGVASDNSEIQADAAPGHRADQRWPEANRLCRLLSTAGGEFPARNPSAAVIFMATCATTPA
jgi:hypothetical protein